MGEDRQRILRMLAEGKISIDEAEDLLNAAGDSTTTEAGERSADDAAAGPTAKRRPKYLRILVSDGSESKVNIRVPLALARAGIKLRGLIPAKARERLAKAAERKGIDVDLSNLDLENVDELMESLADLNVEVEDGQETVRIFCE